MARKSKTQKLILFALGKAIDTGITLYDFANNPHHYAYGMPNIQRYSFYHAVHKLTEKGYIEKSKNAGKIILKLTGDGKSQLLIQKALENKKWDRKWRVVIFDIPEKHRKVRDAFRHRLKEWSFVAWQKSAWVSKKDLEEPLRNLIKELGIEDWALVLVSDNVGRAPKFFDREE